MSKTVKPSWSLPVILSAFADNITHAIKEKTFLFYPFFNSHTKKSEKK